MWICQECGKKYGEYREDLLGSTWHYDYCDWCQLWKAVTEDRDYSYPMPLHLIAEYDENGE